MKQNFFVRGLTVLQGAILLHWTGTSSLLRALTLGRKITLTIATPSTTMLFFPLDFGFFLLKRQHFINSLCHYLLSSSTPSILSLPKPFPFAPSSSCFFQCLAPALQFLCSWFFTEHGVLCPAILVICQIEKFRAPLDHFESHFLWELGFVSMTL